MRGARAVIATGHAFVTADSALNERFLFNNTEQYVINSTLILQK